MFRGNSKTRRVDLGQRGEDKTELLARARRAREARALESSREKAARTIQASFRRYQTRVHSRKQLRVQWGQQLRALLSSSSSSSPSSSSSSQLEGLMDLARQLCFFAVLPTRAVLISRAQKLSSSSSSSSSSPSSKKKHELLGSDARLLCQLIALLVQSSKRDDLNKNYVSLVVRAMAAGGDEGQLPVQHLHVLRVATLCLRFAVAGTHPLVFPHAKQEAGLALSFVQLLLTPSKWAKPLRHLLRTSSKHRLAYHTFLHLFAVRANLLVALREVLFNMSVESDDHNPNPPNNTAFLAATLGMSFSLLDHTLGANASPDSPLDELVGPFLGAFFTVPLLGFVLRPSHVKQLQANDHELLGAILARTHEAVQSGTLDVIFRSMGVQPVLGVPPQIWLLGNLLHISHLTHLVASGTIELIELYARVVTLLMHSAPGSVVRARNVYRARLRQSKNKRKPANLLDESDSDSDSDSDDDNKRGGAQRKLNRALGSQMGFLFHSETLTALVLRIAYPSGVAVSKRYVYTPADLTPEQRELHAKVTEFSDTHPQYVPTIARLLRKALSWLPAQRFSALNTLCFSTPVVDMLWRWLFPQFKGQQWQLWEALIIGDERVHDCFQLFVLCYNQLLILIEDAEFQTSKSPFADHAELCEFTLFLKMFVFRSVYDHAVDDPTRRPPAHIVELFGSCAKLLNELYRRDVRSRFAPEGHWIIGRRQSSMWVDEWLTKVTNFRDDVSMFTNLLHPRIAAVMSKMPFVVPFMQRVAYFRKLVEGRRAALLHEIGGDPRAAPEIVIRRNHIVEDGLDQALRLGAQFRQPFRVAFLDESGRREEGIDMGGPFKEFLETFTKEVFREEYGLFRATEAGEYYPNPTGPLIVPDCVSVMRLVGRVVGKALFEGILVDVPFATFFLCKMLKQSTFLSHLQSLDKDIYRNLLFLKTYEGDVRDLGLTFAVTDDALGVNREIELRPGGSNIDVDNSNRIQFIYMMADLHLNRKIRAQSRAFIEGMHEIIEPSWVQMFNTNELQVLLSGTDEDIDVEDWAKHTRYDNYGRNDRIIKWFWKIVAKFTPAEKAKLLRFVTSCRRPPLMGFKHLQPPFTIRRIGAGDQARTGSWFSRTFGGKDSRSKARLPVAATCFNLLKLPEYDSKKTLEEKLRAAIHDASGFLLQ